MAGSVLRSSLGIAGFAVCSLVPTWAWAGDLIPPKVEAVSPTGVSLSDGAFRLERTDLSVGTITLKRTHSGSVNSIADPTPIDPNTMFNGIHWSNNFDIYVTPAYTKISNQSPYARPTVHTDSQASGMYLQTAFTGTQTLGEDNLDARRGILRWVTNKYEYTDSSGAVYTFNPAVQPAGVYHATKTNYAPYAQRVAQIAYPDGRVRSFSYVSGKLKLVSDSTGYAAVFDWTANGVISAACGFVLSQSYVTTATTCAAAPLKVGYAYTTITQPNGEVWSILDSATDTLGNAETYTVGQAALITCVKPAGFSGCKISNVWASGGLSQTLADGSTWTYGVSDWSGRKTEDQIAGNCLVETNVIDPKNLTSTYFFTGTSPCSFLDSNNRLTEFVYTGGQTMEELFSPTTNFGSFLVSVTQPEGNQYVAENNGPFGNKSKETWKAKPGSGQPDVVVQYGYSYTGTAAQNAKPIWIKDANGNQTDYTYAMHGGVLSELQPAANLTDVGKVPATVSARPLKLTSYVQRYAWIKNAGGTLVQAATPVWVVASETLCQAAPGSNSPVCDAGRQQTVTTYEYGATGTGQSLLVKGVAVSSGGTTLRTCYGYDSWHRKISETKPNASLAVCP